MPPVLARGVASQVYATDGHVVYRQLTADSSTQISEKCFSVVQRIYCVHTLRAGEKPVTSERRFMYS